MDDKDERAAARADIKVNGKKIHIFNTHLIHTHQKASAQREAQINRLIEKLPPDNVVVMGDFNATPESATIRAMNKVLVDADPSSAPTWSMHPEGCRTCNPQAVDTRLDYIFVSKNLKIHSFAVGKSNASDHLPISATVEI